MHIIFSRFKLSFNEKLIKYFNELKEKGKGRIRSNRGGWQSELMNPKENIFLPLAQRIDEVTKNLNLGIVETFIPQLWISINQRNDYNAIHQHGGGYSISGTYYVKTPEDCGRIVFRDPRPSAIGNAFFNHTFDKSEFRVTNLEEGLLMLWPSFLDHFVEPSNTDEQRITISFDLDFKYNF
jgi:uncharacterized protein (TIGR02466 family)